MAALSTGAFRSKQFTCLIGEKRAAFTIHVDVIAKQSPALDALVNGAMVEAVSKVAAFEDVEEDTFERFCQFAYTGDCTTPNCIEQPGRTVYGSTSSAVLKSRKRSGRDEIMPEYAEEAPALEPEPVAEIEATPEVEVELPQDDVSPWNRSVHSLKSRSQTRSLRRSLEHRYYDIATARGISKMQCKIRENSNSHENYTPIFLGHAQLYVFADKWGIETLKQLALHKLHKTLITFTLYADRRPDVVELLRYAYSIEHTPDRAVERDELRSLVLLYATCHAENLILCPEFISLIGEGGSLSEELVKMMMKRIE